MDNHITIAHQDGNIILPFRNGGYAISDDGGLAFSVETEAAADVKQRPNCAKLCSFGHPEEPLKVGAVFEAEGGLDHDYDDEDEAPHACAYFGFFPDELSLSWKVVGIEGEDLVVTVEALTDDVDYYDDRGKRQPVTGTFRLPRRESEDLWNPM